MSERVQDRVRGWLGSPGVLTGSIQVLKSTIAAAGAWWLAVVVFDTELPFLAPWTALLTVHATIYRSLNRGLQTTLASALGVGLSFVVGSYLGVNVWTFALALLVGLVAAHLKWIRDEGVAIATTAIFVLASGYSDQEFLLIDRLIEVGLGVGVGIAVNLVLVPPLREKQAAQFVDRVNRRMGEVLIDIAEDLTNSWDTDHADSWLAATVSIDDEVDAAWGSVTFARESRRANPRAAAPRRPRTRNRPNPYVRSGQRAGYEDILDRLSEGVSHLRHLARTLREATAAERQWDARFSEPWLAIVRDAGYSIKDPDADVEPVHDRLATLAAQLSDGDLPEADWPFYGSLITSMRHIAVIVDDVASARQAREASRANPPA